MTDFSRGVNSGPGAKDWRDNIYTGPGMPSADAQRDARQPLSSESKFIAGGLFVVVAPALILASLAYAVWSLLSSVG